METESDVSRFVHSSSFYFSVQQTTAVTKQKIRITFLQFPHFGEFVSGPVLARVWDESFINDWDWIWTVCKGLTNIIMCLLTYDLFSNPPVSSWVNLTKYSLKYIYIYIHLMRPFDHNFQNVQPEWWSWIKMLIIYTLCWLIDWL